MTNFLTHGRILGGVVTTPDLAGSIMDYRGILGLELVERAQLSDALAASWSATCRRIRAQPSTPLCGSGPRCWKS